jgi:hypothetical protein
MTTGWQFRRDLPANGAGDTAPVRFGTTGLSGVFAFVTASARRHRRFAAKINSVHRTPRSRGRRLAIVLGVLVLGGIVAACGEANAASNPPKLAGAFVNWGAVGREHTLQIWEKWLRQAPSSVLGVDFYGQSTWQDFSRFSWVPGVWKKLNPARNVVWSVPLTLTGTPLADVADGKHDADFEAAARAIAEAQPGAIIRLGWEMNLVSMAWFAKDREADYIAAFRRVVQIFRRYSSAFKFDWCPGWGAQDSAADLAYPGDDVVDYIGLDVYDFKHEGSLEQRWNSFYVKAPFGLEWHRDFAARHGKPMSYPEWGVGNSGDNPFFIQQMHDWFMKNADNIAYAAYFDVDGLWPTQIDNNQFPNSQKLFRRLFRR